MQYIELMLFPIIYVMSVLLSFFHTVSGSYGIAIVLLSVVMSFAIVPIARYGKRIQDEEEELQEGMQPEIKAVKKEFKGEEQFLRIEAIYKRHNYHPIHSLKSMAGLLPQIPFLLAALFFLWDHPPLSGQSFLLVRDLGLPDAMIAFSSGDDTSRINLLPFLMSGISLMEVFMAKGSGAGTKLRLAIVSLVLLVLVYQLPSAVLVYWTSNNIISLLRAVISGRACNTRAE